MDMGDAADMESADGSDEGNTLAESFMNRLLAKTLNDKKAVLGEHMDKVKHYQALLAKRREKDEFMKSEHENVPLLDKAFFVNEELDSITKGLQTKISSTKTTIND
jgi:primase-polymerase (primpol)-like protein